MMTLVRFLLAYAAVSVAYVFGLMYSGSEVGGYVVAQVMLFVATSVAWVMRVSWFGYSPDPMKAKALVEWGGIFACISMAMLFGFVMHHGVAEANNMIFVICAQSVLFTLTFLVGWLPFELSALRAGSGKRWFISLLALGAVFFQPPLEGGGRIMQWLIENIVWVTETATRVYNAIMIAAFMMAAAMASTVPSLENKPRLGSALVTTSLCLAGFNLALALRSIGAVIDGRVEWPSLIIAWLAGLFTFVAAGVAGTLYERGYHWLNQEMSIVVFCATVAHAILTPAFGFGHAFVLVLFGSVAAIVLIHANELASPSPDGPQLKVDGPRRTRQSLGNSLLAWVCLLIIVDLLYTIYWPHHGPGILLIFGLICGLAVMVTIRTQRHLSPN